MAQELKILDAAIKGSKERVEDLLNAGASLSIEDGQGYNALLFAARYGHLQLVIWLVTEKRVNIFHQSKTGKTALYCAAKGGHKAVAEWLIQHGANIYDQDQSGITVLDVAKNEGHQETFNYLQSVKENIEREDLVRARIFYAENQKEEALHLIYSLVQRNREEAKLMLDEIMKHPALEECEIGIPLTHDLLEKFPKNSHFQLLLANLFCHLAQLTPSVAHAKTACEEARDCYKAILRYNPANHRAIEGLENLVQIKKAVVQKKQEKKIAVEKQQMEQEIDTLSKLIKSHVLDARSIEQRFIELEQRARTIKNIEVYITRGDYYFELAMNTIDQKVKEDYFDRSIYDFRKAMEIDSSRKELSKRIEEILSTKQSELSPPPTPTSQAQSDPRLFKAAPTIPPLPNPPTVSATIKSPKVSPQSLAELGKKSNKLPRNLSG